MPNEIPEHSAKNFTELLSQLEKFQKKTKVSWSRGMRAAKYHLEPSLYRHPKLKKIEDLLSTERQITTRFVQRSLPYLSRRLVGDWDKLFLMQHYGVPTRLLDWTENPMVSAYFALQNDVKHKDDDAVIWLCDPEKWNQSAFRHISYKGGVFDEDDDNIAKHKPGTPLAEMPDTPIMMFGSYNSPRIVAQRGVFALFGKSMSPMDEFFKASDYEAGCLEKIIVPAAKVDLVRESLFRKGFTESVVFPEIEGLAKELRRENGYE
ncbi:FRG domain-containing protein [Nitratireductor sp. XY-223]|uniref:FRG domain-containing protein n=1 Tax=Nitratireductor sp. XY-223 TaxID=2561926 RepID=UPI0010AAF222|nr:FRG domain-containing protein [Nitratireductor sp. XY-223]